MSSSDNHAWWEEVSPRHIKSEFYDVSAFVKGRNTLGETELQALGAVEGKRLLHLMCHFGLDTLSLARMGASVTGVDFSEKSVATASELAQQIGLQDRSRFICADVLDLPKHTAEKFDVVFTTHGILEWLPDLSAWGKIIAGALDSAGYFYLLDVHPVSLVFDELSPDKLQVNNDYLTGWRGMTGFDRSDYADRNYVPRSGRTKRLWPLESVFGALIGAGLRITEFREFPFSTYKAFPMMERRNDGLWYLPEKLSGIPLYFSIKARRA